MTLDAVDKKLLNLLQSDFPLEREPFKILGTKLDLDSGKVIKRVERLKREGIIRGIGGVFDSAKLGYRSTLVAMHLPENRLDDAASVISEHKGVSHNYARNHYYNLWFTLTLPVDRSLPKEISALAERAGAESTIDLPATRVFKIRVYLDMLGEEKSPPDVSRDGDVNGSFLVHSDGLSSLDKEVIKVLQKDLPIKERPFDEMAGCLDLATDELLSTAKGLQSRGIMRRYSAVLRHRRAGFVANAMSCWVVPPDSVEQVGRKMAAYKKVSHCYQRQTAANWPYNLFAMIHDLTEEGCQAVAEDISRDTGISNYVLLYSTKEYKKERVQYFTESN